MEDTMTPGHRLWKKSILTGDALCAAWWPCPPFTWNNSISLALNLCILTWTTTHGLNVISATPHSTMWYLGVIGPCQEKALRLHFFLLQSFKGTCRPISLDYPLPSPPSWIILASLETPSENTCSRFTSVLLVLKMAWKQLCPDGSNVPQPKRKRITKRSLCQKDTKTNNAKIKRNRSSQRLSSQK